MAGIQSGNTEIAAGPAVLVYPAHLSNARIRNLGPAPVFLGDVDVVASSTASHGGYVLAPSETFDAPGIGVIPVGPVYAAVSTSTARLTWVAVD